jgi:hypothetical protein
MIRKLFKWTIYGVVGLFALVFVISAVASFGTDSGQPQQADKQPIKNTANQEPEKQPWKRSSPPSPSP